MREELQFIEMRSYYVNYANSYFCYMNQYLFDRTGFLISQSDGFPKKIDSDFMLACWLVGGRGGLGFYGSFLLPKVKRHLVRGYR